MDTAVAVTGKQPGEKAGGDKAPTQAAAQSFSGLNAPEKLRTGEGGNAVGLADTATRVSVTGTASAAPGAERIAGKGNRRRHGKKQATGTGAALFLRQTPAQRRGLAVGQ
ncbi:hypothetical protein D6445_23645 [Salmonella enterica subsp. enterica serovar Infantis]|nr:hypothetical protein [Salmonella enterica subsp. enterica serovar Infantis]